jgi:hypothetical protein
MVPGASSSQITRPEQPRRKLAAQSPHIHRRRTSRQLRRRLKGIFEKGEAVMTTQAGSNAGSLTDTFISDAESRQAESMSAIIGGYATGSYLFGGQPGNTDTITIGGTAVEFVTTPATGKVTIGGTLALTLTALLAFLQASVDANLVLMTYAVDTTHLYVTSVLSGIVGNSYTIVAGSGSNATASGATLSGGGASAAPQIGQPWATTIAGQIGADPPFPAILVNG